MPEKFGQKLLWIVINTVFTLVVALTLFFAGKRFEWFSNTETKIEEKADITYVDKQDALIQKNLDNYKTDHAKQETFQHNAILREFDDLREDLESNRDLIIEAIKGEN